MQRSKMTIGMLALIGTFPATGVTGAEPRGRALEPFATWDAVELLRPPCEPQTESFHSNRLLVRFKAGIARADRQAVHDAAQATRVLRSYHAVDGLQLVEVPENALSAALAAYTNHPDVLYAEPDYVVYPVNMPDDPDFGQLWGLHNTGQTVNDDDPGTPGADIQAVDAWDIWTGDPNFRIAVIDTGVDSTHPDLQDNIWTNPGEFPNNGIDDDGNGYIDDVHGYDFLNNEGEPTDDRFHGTHVAGTIGAVGDNGLGVVGVNWHCKIVSLRFLSDR